MVYYILSLSSVVCAREVEIFIPWEGGSGTVRAVGKVLFTMESGRDAKVVVKFFHDVFVFDCRSGKWEVGAIGWDF